MWAWQRALRGAAVVAALTAAMPVSAVVNYSAFAVTNSPTNSMFYAINFDSSDFITSDRTITFGLGSGSGNACAGGSGNGSGSVTSCTSATFSPHATVGGVLGDYITANFPGGYQVQSAFADGSFGADNFYLGTASFGSQAGGAGQPGIAGLSVSGSPGAPGPLLGAGLLPALATLGGLAATRLRRRKPLAA